MNRLDLLWKKHDYHAIYQQLKKNKYDYTIDNFKKDFCSIDSTNSFCYLIYLLSNDYCVKNILLVLDFLMYTDTFFYDIHPVIRMIFQQALYSFPSDDNLLNWIVCTYENHPDSPFSDQELKKYKALRNTWDDS